MTTKLQVKGSWNEVKGKLKQKYAQLTDDVARVRIEKAKTLLLDPNQRVREVGYAVGFQPLTHFNRVFRKIVDAERDDRRTR